MKKCFIPFVILLFSITTVQAQKLCDSYYPLEKGTSFQITNYDKKDKPTTVVDYHIKNAESDWALLAYEITDKKEGQIINSEYEIRCINNGISIDFNSMVPPEILSQYEDIDIEVTGTNLFVPNELLEGSNLPDAEMLMTISLEPIKLKMNFSITNRKVSGKEKITTPAGEFDCILLTYDFESKLGFKVTGTAKQWIAKGYGTIKQQDFNKKGKLIGSSMLTKFSN